MTVLVVMQVLFCVEGVFVHTGTATLTLAAGLESVPSPPHSHVLLRGKIK